MSDNKPNGTDLFMAIVSGMSGPKASEGWTRQKLENDITWLASELTRMKDENARLQASLEKSDDLAVKMSDKISSLKADVERLTAEADWKTPARRNNALQAQVERLTKAGDAMADECSNFQGAWPLIKDWNAAKEGKQS